MYYLLVFCMVSSSALLGLVPYTMSAQAVVRRSFPGDFLCRLFPSGIALLFFAFALFFAPDSPEQRASICQRHNPVAACQVW